MNMADVIYSSNSNSSVLPALQALSLAGYASDAEQRHTHNAVQFASAYPSKWALKDSRNGFLKQARLLDIKNQAHKLVAQQALVKGQAQQQLMEKVKQVTDTPLLEGGLYEYRQQMLKEKTKRVWSLKNQLPTRHKVKVKLREHNEPLAPAGDVPVVYVNNVDGIKSFYKFRESNSFVVSGKRFKHTDVFNPPKPINKDMMKRESLPSRRLPAVAKFRRFPKIRPGMVTKWV